MKNLTLEQLETIHELNLAVTKAIKVLGIKETSEKIQLYFNMVSKDQWIMDCIREEDAEENEYMWGINYGSEVQNG